MSSCPFLLVVFMCSSLTTGRESLSRLIDILAMGGGRVAQSLMSFLSVTVLARFLGAEQLGVYSIVLAIFAYGSHVSEFGLRSIIMREWNAPYNEVKLSAGLYFFIRFVSSGVVTSFGYLGAVLFFPEYATLVGIVLLSTFAIAFQLDWLLLVTEHYLAASWVLVIRPLFYVITVLILGFTDQLNLNSLVIAFVLSWLALALATWFFADRSTLSITADKLSLKNANNVLRHGWPILFIALIGQAVQSFDLLWVGMTLGAKEAGHYYLASSIIVAGMVFANAMSQMSLARMSRHMNDKRAFAYQVQSDLRIILWVAAALCFGVIFVAKPLIPRLFGESYVPSSELIVYFIPYFLLSHISAVLSSCVVSVGEQRQLLNVNIVRAALLVLLLYLSSFGHGVEFIAIGKSLVELSAIAMTLKSVSSGYFSGVIFSCWTPVCLVLFVWVIVVLL